MRNVSDKSFRENQNTYFMLNVFRKLCHYDIMWKNIVEPNRPQMTICALHAGYLRQQMLSECVIFIAFLLQYLCLFCFCSCGGGGGCCCCCCGGGGSSNSSSSSGGCCSGSFVVEIYISVLFSKG
jgi:hypothetical protein